MVALLLAVAAFAGTSVDELVASGARAGAVVEACRAHPEGCTDVGSREALGRAFYTRALAGWVHGQPVDPEDAANVLALHPSLFERLPDPVRQVAAEPSAWVVALITPSAPHARPSAPTTDPIAPVASGEPSPPTLLPDDPPPLVAATRSLRAGDPASAAIHLHGLADEGHKKARALLAVALEALELPSAALLVLDDLLSDPSAASLYAPYVTPRAVRLAERIGSRRPLVALAAAVPPSSWAAEARSDAWLARAQMHQEQGELSRALAALAQIAPEDDASVEGAWRAGLIHRQVHKPWAAVRSFRQAWNAPAGQGAYADLVRDAAAWNLAATLEEVGRAEDAIGTCEVLSLTGSPLASRCALRSAWTAARLGDLPRARLLLAPVLEGPRPAEAELLLARLAHVEGDPTAAERHVDATLAALTPVEGAIRRLLEARDAWSHLTRGALPAELRDRLDTEPTLVAFRHELAALARDRARIDALPPTWRSAVGDALDERLATRETEVRGRANAALYHVVSDLERELVEARALAEAMR